MLKSMEVVKFEVRNRFLDVSFCATQQEAIAMGVKNHSAAILVYLVLKWI